MSDRTPDHEGASRLTGEGAQARRSAMADHEDELAPGKGLRDRARASRTERMGNGTPVGGPITSPPVEEED